MCASVEFCASCAPTADIIAYTEGRTHLMPAFGDRAQMQTTMLLRMQTYRALLKAVDPSIYDWPEYRQRHGYSRHVQRVIKQGRPVLLSGLTMPDGLRAELKAARARVQLQNGVRRVNDRYARREYKRVYRAWVKKNLAEAEQLVLGRVVYAETPIGESRKDYSVIVFQPELCRVAA